MKKNTIKRVKEKIVKCWNCKKRKAKYECYCGFKICAECSDRGKWCPADEMIDHIVEPIKSKVAKNKVGK